MKIDNELVDKDNFLVFSSTSTVNIIVDNKAYFFVIKSLTKIEYPPLSIDKLK